MATLTPSTAIHTFSTISVCYPKRPFLGTTQHLGEKGTLERQRAEQSNASIDPVTLFFRAGQFHVHHKVGGVTSG